MILTGNIYKAGLYRQISRMSRIRILRCRGQGSNTIRVKVVHGSWIARLIIPHMAAITIWNRIYVRSSVPINERLIRHEVCHVQQWHRLGPLRFISSYLWQSLLHGYRNNKFEIEAREAENRIERDS